MHNFMNKTIQSFSVKSCRKSCLLSGFDLRMTTWCWLFFNCIQLCGMLRLWEAGVSQTDGERWERTASLLIISKCSVTQHGSRLLPIGGSAARAAWVISVLWQSSGGNCTGGWSCDCTGPSAHLILSQQCDTLTASFFFPPTTLWRAPCPPLHPPGNDSRAKLDHRQKKVVCFQCQHVLFICSWIELWLWDRR